MWIIWGIIIIFSLYFITAYRHKQKLISLAELFKMQSSQNQIKSPQFDEISIGYIYGMARSLSNNIAKSKKDFAELAGLIYGVSKENQAILTLLEFSTKDENKKKTFIKAANCAMEDVVNVSALLSTHDPLCKDSKTKMPNGLSQLYKEQKKK